MSDKTSRAYGLWDSPISPISLSQGKRLGEAEADSGTGAIVWSEGRGDRGVLVTSDPADPAPRDLTAEHNVRATVGYGGGDFAVAGGVVVFASGGRLFRQALGGGPATAITPPLGAVSSPRISPDGRWVLFVQSNEGDDCVAVAPLDGSNWPVKVAQGRDFYMQPRWHPAGDRIAWIAWDHPNMPWDGTELWLADFEGGGMPVVSHPRQLAGGAEIAIFQPEFAPDGASIAYVSDESGWGHIYLQPLDGAPCRQLTSGDVEYGRPAWSQGQQHYAFVQGGAAIACVRGDLGTHSLRLIPIDGGNARELPGVGPYTSIDHVSCGPGMDGVLFTGSSATQPPRVVSVDGVGGKARTLARSAGETVPAAALSRAETVSWPSFDGEIAHGFLYPPASERFAAEGKPPLIVLIHGGPTSQSTAGWSPQAQFFATRGYAVLVLNYRGSTGFGRDYMLKLRASWGIYDVEDARTGCLYLAERGLVDSRRRVIMGGSAGGFTVLQSLVTHPGFYTAGICMFGVANQFALAADTHKFEARYLDTMLGPLPEAAPIYRERSPIFHAERITDPIAVFQGDIDQVVPRNQSDTIVDSLRSRGVPHEYHVYEGEGHGWRKSETIERFYKSVDRFLREHVVFA
ncbi:MAG: S9 family peptidase [Dehalococcoidia bacterium]